MGSATVLQGQVPFQLGPALMAVWSKALPLTASYSAWACEKVPSDSGSVRDFCQVLWFPLSLLKGQMHHHDDLGSKCAYMCHLSNKTTRKSVLLSTPQIWLMKVSKKLA